MSESKYSQVRCSAGEDEEEDPSGPQNHEANQPMPSHFKKSSAELSSNLMNGNPESSEFDSGMEVEDEVGSLRRMAPFGDDDNGGDEIDTGVANDEAIESEIQTRRLEESEEVGEGLEGETGRGDGEFNRVGESDTMFEDTERIRDAGAEEEEERISEEIEIRKGSSANPNTPLITKGEGFSYVIGYLRRFNRGILVKNISQTNGINKIEFAPKIWILRAYSLNSPNPKYLQSKNILHTIPKFDPKSQLHKNSLSIFFFS